MLCDYKSSHDLCFRFEVSNPFTTGNCPSRYHNFYIKMAIRAHYPNDDGILSGNRLHFEARLTSMQEIIYDGEEAHLLTVKLSFLKSFSHDLRFLGAQVDIRLRGRVPFLLPSIKKISPEGLAVHVSDREIFSGQERMAQVGAVAGPSQVNLNVKETRGKKTTFKGERYIHGVTPDDMRASWRLYEEKGCRSGLPPIFRLGIVVCPRTTFDMKIDMSVRRKQFRVFGIGLGWEKTISTKPWRQTLKEIFSCGDENYGWETPLVDNQSVWETIWRELFPETPLPGPILNVATGDGSADRVISQAAADVVRYQSCNELSPRNRESLAILKGLLGFSDWNWKPSNERNFLQTTLLAASAAGGGLAREQVQQGAGPAMTQGEAHVGRPLYPPPSAPWPREITFGDMMPKTSWNDRDLDSTTGVGRYYDAAQM